MSQAPPGNVERASSPAGGGPAEPRSASPLNALSLRAIPLYSTFFLWGFGTGAQQLARPLFARSFGVDVFLVTLVAAANSAAHLVTAPTTGFLTDRFGRKPLVIVGNALRGVTTLLQYFATSYWQFFLLEFIGAVGVSAWATGASIVMADITERENRGRAVAVRGLASRLGTMTGPFLGGVLATAFGLRSLFLFNAITKIPIHLITWHLVRETRPEAARTSRGVEDLAVYRQPSGALLAPLRMRRGDLPDLSLLLRPAVLVLALATLCMSMTGAQGILGTLFPVYAQEKAGLNTADIGIMISLAWVAGFLVSYPNGVVIDRWGRKKAFIPGLLVLAVAAYLLGRVTDHQGVLMMMLVYGLGEGMTHGSSEVYAMDLAPAQGRGAFLGIWATLRNIGGLVAPLFIGATAQFFDISTAFALVGVLLVLSGLLMALFGQETRRAESPVIGGH